MEEPSITVRKIASTQAISTELLAEYVEPFGDRRTETPEERGKRLDDLREQWALYDAALPALAAIDELVVRAVLDLHAPDDRDDCQGCELAGYEAEAPDWPCRTTRVIAEAYGIALPDYVPWARPLIGPEREPRSMHEMLNGALQALTFGFRPLESDES